MSSRAGHPRPAGDPVKPVASRRRGKQLEQAIYDAVWRELVQVGYSRLTMDGVALQANTSKAVLYRRWSGRAELVLDAVRREIPDSPPLPDSGNLRTDLIELLHAIAARFDGIRADVIRGLLGEAFSDPHSAALVKNLIGYLGGAALVGQLLQSAADRGELPTASLPGRVISLPVDLLRGEYLLSPSSPVLDRVIAEIVDEVFLPLVGWRTAG